MCGINVMYRFLPNHIINKIEGNFYFRGKLLIMLSLFVVEVYNNRLRFLINCNNLIE